MLNGGLRRDILSTFHFLLLFYFASQWLTEANSVRRVTKQLKKFSMQIQGYSPSQNDDYVAISYKAEPGYIVKFEPFASADRVHHMLLYGCDAPAMNTGFWRGGQTCSGVTHILYAWARNAPPLELPERVAFPVGNEGDPVQYYVLQIHYAHPFEGNVRDFSGLTVHLSDKRPEFIADVYLFVSSYPILPRQPAFLNNLSCTYESDVELHPFAFRTHTHAMGRAVSAFFKRNGQWRKIGKRNPQWPQLFEPIRDKSLVIRKGDFMAATCRFDSSDKDVIVPMGAMGVDEMCNFYMMYYRRATDPDPFPYGGACTYNENPALVNREYPKEGTTLLPSHPEWEHMAHQTMKAFGVAERARLSHVGDIKLGQVSGLAFDNCGRIVIFHRHTTTWSFMTFNGDNTLNDRTPIEAPTILVGEYVDGALKLVAKYGASMFYMPHSIFVDEDNYYYTTDVGTHQVVKWEIVNDELRPVWELGEKFVPGSDIHHFCKPAGVAVSRADGSVYVADGYCNNRVMKFTKDGHFVAEWGRASYGSGNGLQSRGREFSDGGGANFSLGYFSLPHDVTLDERHRRVFVADRENGRVQAFDEQGDPLFDVRNPTFYRTVYSAHYSDGHGLIFIPGGISSSTPSANTELNAYVVPPDATQVEYAFRPTTTFGFQRPHILRVRDDAVWVGEIGEAGGVLWRLDICGGEVQADAGAASLYGETGAPNGDGVMQSLLHTLMFSSTHTNESLKYNRRPNAEARSAFWSTLFLAALCISGFYLLCYYCVCRQRCSDCLASVFCCCCNCWSSRSTSAATARDGTAAQKFLDRKGFRPLRNLDDEDDGDEESDEEFQISLGSALKR